MIGFQTSVLVQIHTVAVMEKVEEVIVAKLTLTRKRVKGRITLPQTSIVNGRTIGLDQTAKSMKTLTVSVLVWDEPPY